jgi:hypothetical protein
MHYFTTAAAIGLRVKLQTVQYNQLDKGGHFGAWEQLGLLVDERRIGLRSLR